MQSIKMKKEDFNNFSKFIQDNVKQKEFVKILLNVESKYTPKEKVVALAKEFCPQIIDEKFLSTCDDINKYCDVVFCLTPKKIVFVKINSFKQPDFFRFGDSCFEEVVCV